MTSDSSNEQPPRFPTTRWTLVLQSGRTGAERDSALESFCRCYWYPVYAYIRRQGRTAEDAQDLTQTFFVKLLRQEWLRGVEQRQGRFSSWILARLRTHLVNEQRGVQAQKRGGGLQPLGLEIAEAEQWFGAEPQSQDTPERAFERQWAYIVLESAMSNLRAVCGESGKEMLFEQLTPFLTRDPEDGEYEILAHKLQMRKNTIAVAVHRLRQQYRDAVRSEVAAGLSDPGLIQDELRHLLVSLQK